MEDGEGLTLSCPIPISEYPRVLLAHGGGGQLMHQLIDKIFVPTFDNPALSARHDSAELKLDGNRIAFTTDSYVVQPLFFPGGDIGSLAIHGTINDLAMTGARPLWISAGFIIEEGLPMKTELTDTEREGAFYQLIARIRREKKARAQAAKQARKEREQREKELLAPFMRQDDQDQGRPEGQEGEENQEGEETNQDDQP